MPTPHVPKKRTLQELKQLVLGLSIACPFDQKNPLSCQLHEIRKLDLKTRFQWVSRLTLAEAEGIWASHEKCVLEKESPKQK
ncbi:MAG TPA: hypothetical protein VNW30_00865 [Opitutaceae bacterium]|jgi:hypothetical protein|nr:hypothetical protein [Opitutaceae bacterium]